MHKYNIRRYLDFPQAEYEARCDRFRARLRERHIGAAVLSTGANLRYFSGLNTVLYQTTLRPITMVIPADAAKEPVMVVPEVLEATCLATSWVEDIRTNAECYGKTPTDVLGVLCDTMRDLGLAHGLVGMEFAQGQYLAMEHAQFIELEGSLPEAEFVDISDAIWQLRMVKSELEIACLKIACDISGVGVQAGIERLKPGITERDLYAAITATYYRNGAESHFLTFMSGAKGNQVRDGGASDLPFENGHFMKVDGGAVYKGYFCDFCRILSVGRLLESQRRAIAVSARAGAAAIAEAKPGNQLEQLVVAAHRVLQENGFGFYMNAIGHGVGMAIHERPWIQKGSPVPIKSGMVLAIEVGVVDDNRFDDGSYTTEENIAITDTGARVLTDLLSPDLVEC
jgi:Xaa-Pro dipeptidase